MKAYKYRITKIEEFSVEAQDQSEAEDAMNSYLAREGIRGQDVDVELIDITDWGSAPVVQKVTKR